jgi:arabinan endo-1,5-alpha-L-arabinosidase
LTDVNPPGRVLNIDKIKWKDGWPFIGTPTDTPQPVPVV